MLMLMRHFVKNEKKYKAKEPMPSQTIIAYMSSPHPSSSLKPSMTHLKECIYLCEERKCICKSLAEDVYRMMICLLI
jgi:hypothetical protein